MEFFTYINKSLRNLRKLPIKHKEDRSTLVRVRKLLFKARYLNLILPITSNLNLRDIEEGDIFTQSAVWSAIETSKYEPDKDISLDYHYGRYEDLYTSR